MIVSVSAPPIASRRMPVTRAPTGIRPTDSVRAVAPTRPSRTSGASIVRNVRKHLITERGLDPATMSISGYWKLKRTEEGWRDDKAEWARLVEADLATAR